MKEKLENILCELGSTSTSYGIPHLIRSKRLYQKIIWILFIFGASLASYFLINETVLNYFEFDVVTNIQSVYEQPSEFPAVSICSSSNKSLFNNAKPSDLLTNCFLAYNYECFENPNNYFQPFFSNEYGQCFIFNSGKNLTNHSVPTFKSYIGGVDDSFNIFFNKTVDLSVWIHNKSAPFNLDFRNNHFNNRIFVNTDSFTEVSLQKIVEIKQGEPYNRCLNDVTTFKSNKTIIDFIIKSNQTYTQEKCLELCFDLNYIESDQCKCKNVSLGDVWYKCWNQQEKKQRNSCTWKFKESFYYNDLVYKCDKYCPLECVSLSYDIKSSIRLNYDSTRLRIYYGSLKYISIIQEPKMKLIDLVSSIGGTIGLLIGISFVTLFEALEVLIEITLFMHSYYYKKNQTFLSCLPCKLPWNSISPEVRRIC